MGGLGLGWTHWKPIKDRNEDYWGPACYELGLQSPKGELVDSLLVGATENEAKCINDLISTLNLSMSVFHDEESNKPKIFVYHTWRFPNKHEAIDRLEKCLADRYDEYPLFIPYTKKLLVLGRFPEFLENADLLLSFFPNDARLLDEMGFAFQKLGKNKEALGCFDQALDIDPHNESPRKHREELLNQLKKADGDNQDIRTKNPEKIRKPSVAVREYYEICEETENASRPTEKSSDGLISESDTKSSKKSFEQSEQQQNGVKTQGAMKQIGKQNIIQHTFPDNSQNVDPKSDDAIQSLREESSDPVTTNKKNEPEIDLDLECPIIESGSSEIAEIIICNMGKIPYLNFNFEFPDGRFGVKTGNRMSLIKSGETKTTEVEICTKTKLKGKILFEIRVACEDEKNNTYLKILRKPIKIIEQDSPREDHPSSLIPVSQSYTYAPVTNTITQTSDSKTTNLQKIGNELSIGGDAVFSGTNLGGVSQESLNKPPQPPQKKVNLCRKCNAKLEPTEMFCNTCGENVQP